MSSYIPEVIAGIDYGRLKYLLGIMIGDKITPIAKGSIFNTVITANTNMFAAGLSPTNTPTMFKIYACFSAQGQLSVRRTVGAVTITEVLNANIDLQANAAYTFEIVVESGETINLRYDAACTCLVLKVVEVQGAVA